MSARRSGHLIFVELVESINPSYSASLVCVDRVETGKRDRFDSGKGSTATREQDGRAASVKSVISVVKMGPRITRIARIIGRSG